MMTMNLPSQTAANARPLRPSLRARAGGKVQTLSARYLFRRPFSVRTDAPIISFTFDDFPRSAFLEGARILERFGVRGTYYAALGLMGKTGPPGPMFHLEDLEELREQSHELGCHTFGHCHSWNTPPEVFEKSVVENRIAFGKVLPGASLRTLAYPISDPRPGTKRRVSKHFVCCRGGGQTFNAGITDLNNLHAFFLEKTRGNAAPVKGLIDRNCRELGWLIFATHDVCESPSPYGCTPRFFEEVVEYAANSGALILPVARAWEALNANRQWGVTIRFDGGAGGLP
ncbi:MAG: polysaccharide deacetylase family protein [Terriglobia bacterium]